MLSKEAQDQPVHPCHLAFFTYITEACTKLAKCSGPTRTTLLYVTEISSAKPQVIVYRTGINTVIRAITFITNGSKRNWLTIHHNPRLLSSLGTQPALRGQSSVVTQMRRGIMFPHPFHQGIKFPTAMMRAELGASPDRRLRVDFDQIGCRIAMAHQRQAQRFDNRCNGRRACGRRLPSPGDRRGDRRSSWRSGRARYIA